jgi:diguanylate cyclase
VSTTPIKKRRKPWRPWLAAVLVGIFFAMFHVAEPVELALKVARNKVFDRPASGSIALVAIDDRSIAAMGRPPWNGAKLAALLERVRDAGARSVHLESDVAVEPTGPDGARLNTALASLHGRLTLPARTSVDELTGQVTDYAPPPWLARYGELVNVNIFVGWDGSVREHPYSSPTGAAEMASLASRLGDQSGHSGERFPINYSINPNSVPILSASDVVDGHVNLNALAGHDVIIARTDFAAERFWAPGLWLLPAGMLHVLAAETLQLGKPVDLGALPVLLLGALLAGLILFTRRRWVCLASFTLALGGAVLAPIALEADNIFVTVLPGLSIVLVAASMRLIASFRRSFQERGTTNLVTNMPNLQALRQAPVVASAVVVVARVKNYAQITASLQPQHEKEMVDQIVARLSFGTDGSVIYQADEGVFIWVTGEQSEEAIVQQIEALHALFRTPIVVATRLIDVTVSFGMDHDDGRPLLQRVPSAIVAADNAGREGKRWASFNPASLQDAEWAMSLLARLDHAMDADELWVAYQPKFDCRLNRITGAEALVRWTHPEKGQVYPDQFIGAAEEGGRIERLTYFVLDRALKAAKEINASGQRFTMAVNLSALMLSSDNLVDQVVALLRKHDVPPELLVLEVTETSAMGTADEAFANLQALANHGIGLSIDDYGTGFSTLEYLKRIPARELKIDRSFISMLHRSQSDRIMVNSTIQLAHSLGRQVVAEGVENQEILEELQRMGCDLIQGYHIARPASLEDLQALLLAQNRDRRAA